MHDTGGIVLISATYSSNPKSLIPNPSDESFQYDANGNRIDSGWVVGPGNRPRRSGLG